MEITFDDPRTQLRESAAPSILDLRSMTTEASTERSVLVYPNPADGTVRMVVDLSTNVAAATVSVSTVDGRVIAEYACRTVDVVNIDASLWPAGTYVVTAASAEVGSSATTVLIVLP